MKYISLIFCLLIIASSCNKTAKQLREKLANTDSIAINYFKGDGTMDTVVMVKIVKDKKMIEEITGLVSSKDRSEISKCGYDGSLHFFKMNGVIQDVDFRLADGDCGQFSFLWLGKYHATALSGQAKKILTDLKK